MTATTRTVECNADATLWLAFELGSTTWTLGFTTGAAQRPRIRTIKAGDLGTLMREMAAAKVRFGLAAETPVRSVYEAGRDGFWLHRWLVTQGIDNIVVDSSSIEVKRRARHAKTDRLDVRKLLEQLLRWAGGMRRTWSVVHVPTAEAEDARQLAREIETVGVDRTRVRNRIHGLLATQGVRLALTSHFAARLATAQTGDGRPFPAELRERIAHEWAALQTIEARAKRLAEQRTAQIAHGTTRWRRLRGPCSACGRWARRVPRSTVRSCLARRRFRTADKCRHSADSPRCRIAVISASATSGSVKRVEASSGGSRFRVRGAGCAGNATAR